METARSTERESTAAVWRANAGACIAVARAANRAKQRDYALMKLAEARRCLRRSECKS